MSSGDAKRFEGSDTENEADSIDEEVETRSGDDESSLVYGNFTLFAFQ